MSIGPWLDASLPIFEAQPVNPHHPLNQGRVLWWLNLPTTNGGSKWRDLMRAGHGSLSGFGSGEGFINGTRHGSYGAIRSTASGTGRIIEAAGVPGLPVGASDPWTIHFWHRTAANVNLSHAFGFGRQLPSPGGAPTGDSRYVLNLNSSGQRYFFWAMSVGDWITPTAWDADGIWHRIVFTCDGTNLRLYRDGVLSAGPQAKGYTISAGNYVTAFSRHTSASTTANMDLDDCGILSRAWSADDVRADYDLGRRGYPGVLYRRRPGIVTVAPPIVGLGSLLEAGDTLAASGLAGVRGPAVLIEAGDALAAEGEVLVDEVSGSAAIVEAGDAMSALGGLAFTASAAIVEADDALAASGQLSFVAVAALIEAGDAMSASGEVLVDGVSGSAAMVEADDIMTASGLTNFVFLKLAHPGAAAVARQAGQPDPRSGSITRS